jgi:hypothetical protein
VQLGEYLLPGLKEDVSNALRVVEKPSIQSAPDANQNGYCCSVSALMMAFAKASLISLCRGTA